MFKKISSGILIFSLVGFSFIGCQSDAQKQAEAEKKNTNDLLLLLILISLSRPSSSACSYYGVSQGCYSSAPYSCPKSAYCSSSSSCSNLSCDVAANASIKTQLQSSVQCDEKNFSCLLRKK